MDSQEIIKKHYAEKTAVSDTVTIVCLLAASVLLHSVMIPYISKTYGLSGSVGDTTEISDYLLSGASWFSTSLSGYSMPDYKWYLVLMIAYMVQTVTEGIVSHLNYSTVD